MVWGGSEWVNLRWKCAGGRRGQRGEDGVCRGRGVNQVGWMCGWQGYMLVRSPLDANQKGFLTLPRSPTLQGSSILQAPGAFTVMLAQAWPFPRVLPQYCSHFSSQFPRCAGLFASAAGPLGSLSPSSGIGWTTMCLGNLELPPFSRNDLRLV